ncbi:MAG: hypothetical protein WA192_18970 [Candidatus Acidiferrales bacterium]
MIAMILYLLVGAVLFAFLLVLALRQKAPMEGSGRQCVEARQSLRTLQTGILRRNIVERIFDREDLQYVSTATSPGICELFLAERKRISLLWVRRLRDEIRHLMHFHRGYSRLHAQLGLLTEIRLSLDFALLLLACGVLRMLLSWRGPYGAPALVGIITAAAARVCTVSEASLAFLNPPAHDPFRDESATNGVTR